MVRLLTWALAISGVLLYGYFTNVDRDDSGEVVKGGDSSVFDLRIGDCIGASLDGEMSEIGIVRCDDPHQYEVFAAIKSSADTYPGQEALGEEAIAKCASYFDNYFEITYEQSQLYITHFTPTEESWNQANDREITCLAYRMDGESMVGRVRKY